MYTALDRLNKPDVKILTVEDPVEYQMPGINQIQVKPQIQLTFANALRSIVRQDPDIIMKFVSSRPAGLAQGGLSLVWLEVAEDPKDRHGHHLVMRRAMPDDEQKDFRALDKAEAAILIPNVESVAFSYFGAENDFAEPHWVDSWTFASRIPQMIRLRVKTAEGAMVKGRFVSGFCSPAFTWAQTADDARVSNNAACANFIFIVIFP